MKRIAVLCLLAVSSLTAGAAGVAREGVLDLATDAPFEFTIDVGTSPTWTWSFEDDGATYSSMPTNYTAQWWWFEDWQQQAGPVATATCGASSVTFRLTPDQTGSNFAAVSQILILDAAGVPWRAWRGVGEFRESPGSDASAARFSSPVVISSYTWSGVFSEGVLPATWLTNATGDITAVLPGAGLSGGAASGAATLAVSNAVLSGAALGATASQPAATQTAATNAYAAALSTVGAAGYLTSATAGTTYQPTGTYVTAESDPLWTAASGGVVYAESDPAWTAASGSVLYAEADTLDAVAARGPTTTNDVQVGRVLTLRPNGSGLTDYAVVATDTNVGEGSLTLTGGDSSLGDWGSVSAIQLTRNNDLYDGEMTLIAGNNTFIDFLLGENDSTLTIYEDRVDFKGATISNAIYQGDATLDGGAVRLTDATGARSLRVSDSEVQVVSAGVTNALGQLAFLDIDTNAVALSRLPAIVLTNTVEATLSGTAGVLPDSAAVSNWVSGLDLGSGTITGVELAAGDGTTTTNAGVVTIDVTASGGGAVESVNGQTGVVVITAGDLGAITNAYTDLIDKGHLDPLGTPYFVAIHTNTQTITSSNLTQVSFNTDRVDTHGVWDTGTSLLTPSTSGWWTVGARLFLGSRVKGAPTGGVLCYLGVYNQTLGVEVDRLDERYVLGDATLGIMAGSKPVLLDSTNSYSIVFRQDSTDGSEITGNATVGYTQNTVWGNYDRP